MASAAPSAENTPDRERSEAPDPARPYHVRSLLFVARVAAREHGHLLDDAELDVATALADDGEGAMSPGAVFLLSRLYRRKHDQWIPLSALQADNAAGSADSDVAVSAKELVCRGMLLSSAGEGEGGGVHQSALALLPTLNAEKLKALWRMVPAAAKGASKREMTARIGEMLGRRVAARVAASAEKSPKASGKSVLRQGTLTSVPPATRIARHIVKSVGDAYRLSDVAIGALERIHFLVLLVERAHEDHDYVLSFTSRLKLPDFRCIRETPVFPSKAALVAFEAARDLERALDEALERRPAEGDGKAPRDWHTAAAIGLIAECRVRHVLGLEPPEVRVDDQVALEYPLPVQDDAELRKQLEHPFLRRYTSHWVLCRVVYHSVQALEALRKYAAAVERCELLLSLKLMPKRRGKVLERLTINLSKHLGRHHDALRRIVTALQRAADDPTYLGVGDRRALANRATKLHMKINFPQALECLPPRFKNKGRRANEARKAVAKVLPTVISRAAEAANAAIPKREFYREVAGDEPPAKRARYWGTPSRAAEQAKPRGKRVAYRSTAGDGVLVNVEELALEVYRGDGWQGRHDEGGALRHLYSLLMWDVIFAPVPDVFQSRFQDRPLDMHYDAFYATRKELVDGRTAQLAAMRPAEVASQVRALFKQHLGTYAVGCHWRHNDVDHLAAIASGLGGRALAHICRLLAQDYSYWGRGIADLVLWREDQKPSPRGAAGEEVTQVDDDGDREEDATQGDNDGGPEEGTTGYQGPRSMLVEVKSLNDSFSHIQKAWFSELIGMGVACEEFRVVDKDPDADA